MDRLMGVGLGRRSDPVKARAVGVALGISRFWTGSPELVVEAILLVLRWWDPPFILPASCTAL